MFDEGASWKGHNIENKMERCKSHSKNAQQLGVVCWGVKKKYDFDQT